MVLLNDAIGEKFGKHFFYTAFVMLHRWVCAHIRQRQWRRQDLLRGGAKIEIMSWGTHDGLTGRVQQLLDD